MPGSSQEDGRNSHQHWITIIWDIENWGRNEEIVEGVENMALEFPDSEVPRINVN